jgi:uncharacterized surface protein with fasciclin (FAS1) repeats
MENKTSLIIGAVAVIALAVVLFFAFRPMEDEQEVNNDNQVEQDADQNDETQEMEEEMEEPSMNIVETAIDTPTLSTLVSAVQAADLVEALSDESAQLTVFALTNDAFAEIQDTVDTLLLPENKEDLQNVLQYHVVSGEVMSSDLSDGMVVTALNGDTLTVTINENGEVFINDAQVVLADVETSNGVVHVIDTVLVP